MTLRLEIFSYGAKQWIKLGELSHTDQAGSITDTKQDRKEIYAFQCEHHKVPAFYYGLKSAICMDFGMLKVFYQETL